MATKRITKQQHALYFLQQKVESLTETKEMNLYCVLYSEAREFLGIVHGFWVIDLIDDKTRDFYNNVGIFFLRKAEEHVHLTEF